MAKTHYMYVVRCADGTLYTGYATDVRRRVDEHNTSPKGAKYTRSRRPVELVATAAFATKQEAMRAEYHFKRLSRHQKNDLIARTGADPLEELLGEEVLGWCD